MEGFIHPPIENHLLPLARPASRQGFREIFLQEPAQTLDTLVKSHQPGRRVSDQQLGDFDDRIKLVGGAALATLATLGLTRRILGVGETLGFLGFFGAMALTPKIVHAMVQMKTGLDMNQEFFSSQSERRWMYQDPKYLPLHLLSDSDLQRIGKKLNIPEETPDHRRVIEDRIHQIASQSLTWWMLIAGPATPVIGSLFSHVLENPVRAGISKTIQLYNQAGLKLFSHRPDLKNKHLDSALNQRIGQSAESGLSRWWEQFADGVVKHSGLSQSTPPKIFLNKTPEDRLDTLAKHFHHKNYNPKAFSQYIQTQQDRLTQIEKGALNLLQGQKSSSTIQIQKVKDRIANARATLAHYNTLLQQTGKGDKPDIRRLKSLMNNSRIAEIERLIQQGHSQEAKRLSGGSEIFERVKTFIREGRFEKAVEALGDSIGNHLDRSTRNFMRRKLWRQRILLGLGGGLTLLSLIYTQLFMARGQKSGNEKTLTSHELKNRYASSAYLQSEKELETLKLLQQQLGPLPPTNWTNPLKHQFQKNQAIIYALNLRTFGAHDTNGDGIISPSHSENGTFLSAIKRLDNLKDLGVNTIHLLPINSTGIIKRKGKVGSLYAPSSLLTLGVEYDTPGNRLNVIEEARLFIREAHKRGISVMVDVPSAASLDLALRRPDLIATDASGHTLTPTTWSDIVMFENNQALTDYYQGFFDLMANQLGVDGFRVDVARARPPQFWKYFTDQYPKHAWLAESYTYEDASPLENIPRDNPLELLSAGFDSIYGQLHTFHQMRTANEYQQYLADVNRMIKMASGYGKSMIGSFLTHDDEETVMDHGGVVNSNLVSGLMATQPFTNPYILDGYTTGFSHRLDIFNHKQAPKGLYPEIGTFLQTMLDLRKQYPDAFATGNYTPVPVLHDRRNQIIAFTRQSNHRTFLVIANKDVNARSRGAVHMPALPDARLSKNLAPEYGQPSIISPHIDPTTQMLNVDLGPGRFHVFEVTAV